MLDEFQVRDLPLFDVVIALETAPLNAVVQALEDCSSRGVLVLDPHAAPRGLVLRDSVFRLAARLSLAEMRIGMLPLMGVVELSPDALLIDAARAVAAAGAGGIVCRLAELTDPMVMLRDEMLNVTDWAPLRESRSKRESGRVAAPALTPPAHVL
jgi:hypothetical protein